ncbi:helix-turn-helix transcriptional regulator [Virgibacillus salexigens]|uniref:helix-turn-helix transcriptional regulator n=1 Tax=Virgibacillus kapii TaxID=1638645 RepID=UPI00166D4EA3
MEKGYVAKQLGVHRDTISNWCANRGMLRLDQAVKLADILKCEVTDLYIKEVNYND